MKTPANPPRPAVKRVLLVDDHPLMRDGIKSWIARASDLAVCGEADTAATAVRMVESLHPDIVVTDLSLKGRNGIDLIKDLHVLQPALPVLVLSMHNECFYARRVLQAGAAGYVMKGDGGERLVAAIRRVLAGGVEVSDEIVRQVIRTVGGRQDAAASPVSTLTDRELEIFEMIGRGCDSNCVARALGLSAKTVHVHRGAIRRKLGVANDSVLIHHAVRWLESEDAAKSRPSAPESTPVKLTARKGRANPGAESDGSAEAGK